MLSSEGNNSKAFELYHSEYIDHVAILRTALCRQSQQCVDFSSYYIKSSESGLRSLSSSSLPVVKPLPTKTLPAPCFPGSLSFPTPTILSPELTRSAFSKFSPLDSTHLCNAKTKNRFNLPFVPSFNNYLRTGSTKLSLLYTRKTQPRKQSITGRRRGGEFLDFRIARHYVRSLKIGGVAEWRRWCASPSRPLNIPTNPDRAYTGDWKGYGDWLGGGSAAIPLISNRDFLPFEVARSFVRKLNLNSRDEWWRWCKTKDRPFNIPISPKVIYKCEWKGYGDWLGEMELV